MCFACKILFFLFLVVYSNFFFQIRRYFLYSCTKKSDQAFILTNNSSDQAFNQCALNWVKVSPFLSQIASYFCTKECLSPEGNLESRSRLGSIWVSYTLSSLFLLGYRKCRFPPRKRKYQNALLCGWVGGWMDGWMDGRVVIFHPFRFSWFLSMIMSNISRIRKFAQKLPLLNR